MPTRLGDAEGADGQWRCADGWHIRQFGQEFVLHQDAIDPRVNPVGHLVQDVMAKAITQLRPAMPSEGPPLPIGVLSKVRPATPWEGPPLPRGLGVQWVQTPAWANLTFRQPAFSWSGSKA